MPLDFAQRVVEMHVPVFPVVLTVQVSLPLLLSDGEEVVQHFSRNLSIPRLAIV